MKERLLIVILALIPFGNLLRFDIGYGVSVLLIEVMLGILLVANFWEYRSKIFSEIPRSIIPFIILAITSLLLNTGHYEVTAILVGSLYLVRLLLYVQLLFSFNDLSKKIRTNILEIMVLVGSIYALIGLGQYVLFPDLRPLYFLGWDEHLYRLFGTFLDPNFSGGFIILSLTLILSSLSLKLDRVNRYQTILVFIHVLAIVLTYSRSSYLMFAVMLAMYGVLLRKNIKHYVGIAVGFGILVLLIPKGLPSEGVNLLRTASINARFVEYEKAIEVFQSSPIYGVGYNLYRYAQFKFGLTETGNWVFSHAAAGVPNSFLFVLATTGILGFAAYVYFWFESIRRKFHPVLLVSVVSIFVHALFENSLFYPFIMIWLFSLISLLPLQSSKLSNK